jgi:hypothetical protein
MAKRRIDLPVDAYAIFLQARRFENAASVLPNVVNQFGFPAATLYAFSLELHFKCLFCIRKPASPVPFGHQLLDLYRQLDVRDQVALGILTDTYVAKSEVIQAKIKHFGLRFDVMSILVRCNNLFDNIRYFYEHRQHEKDAFGKAGQYGIEAVIEACRQILLDECPDWAKRIAEAGVK